MFRPSAVFGLMFLIFQRIFVCKSFHKPPGLFDPAFPVLEQHGNGLRDNIHIPCVHPSRSNGGRSQPDSARVPCGTFGRLQKGKERAFHRSDRQVLRNRHAADPTGVAFRS